MSDGKWDKAINYASEVHPSETPYCHCCGALLTPVSWKCLSCGEMTASESHDDLAVRIAKAMEAYIYGYRQSVQETVDRYKEVVLRVLHGEKGGTE